MISVVDYLIRISVQHQYNVFLYDTAIEYGVAAVESGLKYTWNWPLCVSRLQVVECYARLRCSLSPGGRHTLRCTGQVSVLFLSLFFDDSVKDNVRAAGLFWRNDRGAAEVVPSEQTDSEYIIWHNAGTTHVTQNTLEGRNVSTFGKTLGVHGCTTAQEVLQQEESQIRQEHSFSKHVRALMMKTPFENETRSVSSGTPSQRWSCELRVHVVEYDQRKKPAIGFGDAESCPSWSTLVRWSGRRRWPEYPDVPSESKLKLHAVAILVRMQDQF